MLRSTGTYNEIIDATSGLSTGEERTTGNVLVEVAKVMICYPLKFKPLERLISYVYNFLIKHTLTI